MRVKLCTSLLLCLILILNKSSWKVIINKYNIYVNALECLQTFYTMLLKIQVLFDFKLSNPLLIKVL